MLHLATTVEGPLREAQVLEAGRESGIAAVQEDTARGIEDGAIGKRMRGGGHQERHKNQQDHVRNVYNTLEERKQTVKKIQKK